MNTDFFISFTGAYLALHFLLYAAFLRNARFFNQEKSIFFYHFFSFAVLFILAAFVAAAEPGAFLMAGAAVSLHGIYSLSFLELWALSDGGYSLRILDRVQHCGTSADLDSLQDLGASKIKYRLESLKRLGFLAGNSGEWALTRRGRAAAAVLRLIMLVSKQKEAA